MDHLPVPDERAAGRLNVPFLAVDIYSPPFEDYPERSGWRITREDDKTTLHHKPDSSASRDIGALLQSWLYFGLLSEFMGYNVNYSDFRMQHGSNAALLTTENLETMVCARTQLLHEISPLGDLGNLTRWSDSFYASMLKARNSGLMALLRSDESDTNVQSTILAVAVLAEYLVRAMGNLLVVKKLERPIKQTWRIVASKLYMTKAPPDACSPITATMKARGWCPHDIALLNGSQIPSVSTFWYLANLSAPRANMKHLDCSEEQCERVQIDESSYTPAHIQPGCQCPHIGPESSKLAEIIEQGGIPVVMIQDDNMSVSQQSNAIPFVVISHVWADGMGNSQANTLPRCVANQIAGSVNALASDGANTPFWMDTFCVPRGPSRIRKLALSQLKEPYERAERCLVLDSYLRQHLVPEKPSRYECFEMLGRIRICGWSRRLWTFQEGRLPTDPARTWFAFRNRSVDLLVECNITYSHLPTLARHVVDWDLIDDHSQTQLAGPVGRGLPHEALLSIISLRQALRTRSTTRASDEPLCLGTIMRLRKEEMLDIINVKSTSKRMARIWSSLPKVDIGIAFSRASFKLEVEGFRWAPASFMGDLELGNADWYGPNSQWDADPARILPKGLLIQRPGWVFGTADTAALQRLERLCHVDAVPEDQGVVLYESSTQRWFSFYVDDAWHQTVAPTLPHHRLAIIMAGSKSLGQQATWNLEEPEEFRLQGSEDALIVSYDPQDLASTLKTRDEQSVLGIHASAHRHAKIKLVSSKAHEVRTWLKICADNICTTVGSDALEKLRVSARIYELQDLARDGTEAFLQDQPQVLKAMQACNEATGLGNDREEAVNDCVVIVQVLLEYGACLEIIAVDKNTSWCID